MGKCMYMGIMYVYGCMGIMSIWVDEYMGIMYVYGYVYRYHVCV